ncbi:DUF4019 domain-containing protein [Salinibacter altiplanensis]|uniref:DUF4019 domain-containing protein n=1 Tax=Salinibacter altiplanensis TaxID=1803181 RepID=UPI000C9F2A30|nr:DUF4019 domain-containing protein [Salinibacter altiplanensis]
MVRSFPTGPVLFLLAAGVLVVGTPMTASAQSNEQAVTAAKAAAQEWLTLLDADAHEATWDEAATFFKSEVSAEQWTAQVRQAHSSLDSLQSRSLVAARYTNSVPNAPEGEYVIAQYRATYGEQKTVETVSLKKDGEEWRVAGYFIKPAKQQ